MDNTIVVLCAKSGSGKDSLAKLINALDYKFVISTTTRPIRNCESEKNPYYFVSDSEFANLIRDKQLIEYRTYETLVNGTPNTWWYGVNKSEIQDNEKYVVVLDIHGLKEFKKLYGNRVLSFYIHVEDEEREKRAIQRGGFDKTEWDRRLKDDNKVFNLQDVEIHVDKLVCNSELTQCLSDIATEIIFYSLEVNDMEV